jgi:2-keto-4-pentenoate hydratase
MMERIAPEGDKLSHHDQSTESIARAFVEARHAGAALPDYPGRPPQTLDEAYRIQERAIDLHGSTIAGWKVGRIADPLVSALGSNRLAGPIFANMVVEAGGTPPVMPVFGDGFAAAEAEFLLRIGSLPEPGQPVSTNAEAAGLIDAVRIGIEIASSPFPGINDLGPAVTVSDFGNNNGLVLGEPIPLDAPLLHWPVSLLIDGVEAGSGTAADMLDGPFGAARFLFGLAAERPLPLAVGQWISSGAITGVHQVRPGAAIEARFGDAYSVRCAIGANN